MSGHAKPDGVHAVFAVDPGGTTGVFAGWVELKPTRVKTLTEGLLREKAAEVTGDFMAQANELAQMYVRFHFAANEANLPIGHRHVAVEDFQARPNQFTQHLTSCWVAAAFAYAISGLPGSEVTWQQPSDAKRLATDVRLKDWGLWQVGSAHTRDAARHFALRVDRLLG